MPGPKPSLKSLRFEQLLSAGGRLIIADGFYEWRRTEASKKKQPFYFQLRDRSSTDGCSFGLPLPSRVFGNIGKMRLEKSSILALS